MASASLSAATTLRLRLLALASLLSVACIRVCDPMLVTLSAEFQRPTGETAWVISGFALTYGVLQLFYGPLGDRWGKARIVTGAVSGAALASVVAACAASLDGLIVARVLMGAAAAGIVPMVMAWIGDQVDYAHRQETLARLMGATVTGLIAGQVLGGLLTDTVGWRAAFWTLALGFATVAVLLWRASRGSVAERPVVAGPDAPHPLLAPFVLLRAVPVRWLLAVTAVEGALAHGTLAYVPTHLVQRYGMSVAAAGGAMALYGVGGLLYSRVAGPMVRRLGEAGLTVVGGGLIALSLLALAYGRHWGVALPACFLSGLGFHMLHSTLQTQATQMAPEARGTAVSTFACCLLLGQSLGVVAVGRSLDKGSATLAFAIASAAMVLLVVVILHAVVARPGTAASVHRGGTLHRQPRR